MTAYAAAFIASPMNCGSLNHGTCSATASSSSAFIASISCTETRARVNCINHCGSSMSRRNLLQLLPMSSGSNDDDMNNSLPEGELDKKRTRRTDESKNEVIEDLSWRVAKARLEEENKRRILRRKPLKLPYAVSQKWIQRNWAPKTQKEFEELVANGDIKNVYISKRPAEYYGERGEWISWDHYLLGDCSEVGANSTETNNLKWQ